MLPGSGVESETGVGGEAGGALAAEDGDQGVVVVVDFDVEFGGLVAHDSADVLDKLGSGSDWQGEEERIEAGAVEAFAGVGAGGGDEERLVGWVVGDGGSGVGALVFSHAAS